MKKIRHVFRRKIILLVFTLVGSCLFLAFLINKGQVLTVNFLASQIVASCKNKIDWNICYGNALSKINSKMPFIFSINVMEKIQNIDPQTKTCHVISHRLAWSEVAKNPANWLSMFKQIPNPNVCFTGFIHGAIEGKQRYDSHFELTPAIGNQICDQLKKVTKSNNTYPCGHGLGHITLVENFPDLLEASKFCNSLQKDLNRSCLDGLFMEEIFKVNLIEHGLEKPINIGELYAQESENICRSFQDQEAESCWRELSILYSKITGPNFNQLKTHCQRAGSQRNINACYFRALPSIIMNFLYST
jgi:hypothetical protein